MVKQENKEIIVNKTILEHTHKLTGDHTSSRELHELTGDHTSSRRSPEFKWDHTRSKGNTRGHGGTHEVMGVTVSHELTEDWDHTSSRGSHELKGEHTSMQISREH